MAATGLTDVVAWVSQLSTLRAQDYRVNDYVQQELLNGYLTGLVRTLVGHTYMHNDDTDDDAQA